MGRHDPDLGVHDFTNKDWRKRPRKDRAALRDKRLSIRVTKAEYDALEEQAIKVGMNLADYIVCRGLRKRRRLTSENDLTEE